MDKKSYLGQFFTSNVDFILKDFEHLVLDKNIYDPFAGIGFLLSWAQRNKAKSIKGSDIDTQLLNNMPDNMKNIIGFNDSLANIEYSDFVLTNPPYLRSFLSAYNTEFENLFSLAIEKIIDSKTKEGILIIPVNFISAESNHKIRKLFFEKYEITKLVYFDTVVFNDTTVNVIAFHFKLRAKLQEKLELECNNKIYNLTMKDYSIYHPDLNDIYKQKNILNCTKLVDHNLIEGKNKIKVAFKKISNITEISVNDEYYEKIKNNIMFLNCVDSIKTPINVQNIKDYGVDAFISTENQRVFASIFVDLSVKQQEELIPIINNKLNEIRNDTFSMFLSNFRDRNRKRIAFDLFYKLINWVSICLFQFTPRIGAT